MGLEEVSDFLLTKLQFITNLKREYYVNKNEKKKGNSGLEVSVLGMGYMKLSFGTGKSANINDGINIILTDYDKSFSFFLILQGEKEVQVKAEVKSWIIKIGLIQYRLKVDNQ
jgi:c-di-GMP-binding flagellar brake protein YcgR